MLSPESWRFTDIKKKKKKKKFDVGGGMSIKTKTDPCENV